MSHSEVVVLIGPMGVGKTTVGKKLARALGVPFVDTDALITQQHGDISKIFANEGEETFRKYETEALALAIQQPAVVATGGGAVLLPENRSLLEHTRVVYLATDGKHIPSRLRGGNRPLVKNGFEDWRRIYNERKPLYESTANITVDCSGLSLSATLAAIREKLTL